MEEQLIPYGLTCKDCLRFVGCRNKLAKKPEDTLCAGWPYTFALPDGGDRIAAERKRQRTIEGFTAQHDAQWDHDEMILAAREYLNASFSNIRPDYLKDHVPPLWPFDPSWWKPTEDPVRNLVKAGALIAAEIDRLRYIQFPPSNVDDGGRMQSEEQK